jgi:hypothetical protein
MPQGYISAERSIAAAGAAFACPEDDFSGVMCTRNNTSAKYARLVKTAFWKCLLVCGLVVA